MGVGRLPALIAGLFGSAAPGSPAATEAESAPTAASGIVRSSCGACGSDFHSVDSNLSSSLSIRVLSPPTPPIAVLLSLSFSLPPSPSQAQIESVDFSFSLDNGKTIQKAVVLGKQTNKRT